jgi:DNA binding domain, excisionase family
MQRRRGIKSASSKGLKQGSALAPAADANADPFLIALVHAMARSASLTLVRTPSSKSARLLDRHMRLGITTVRAAAEERPKMSDDAARLMSLADAARFLGISMPTAYRLVLTKKLCASKVGGQWRISDECLRKYLEDTINLTLRE